MYERFYQFRERPFALSPDPQYLYLSTVHRAGLEYLRYGIEGLGGFVVITGEIGSGKTTLLQTLLRNLDTEITVVRLLSSILEPRELLEAILLDLGANAAAPGLSEPELLLELARLLVRQRSQQRRVVLIIDEAQNLSLLALEGVQKLSDIEIEKSKLLQIILVGQPELRQTLALPQLKQLRQRVNVTYHLPALDGAETAAYINHRLRRAARGAPLQFPRELTDLVYAGSRGVPRLINLICDAALLLGYAEECRIIDAPLVEAAVDELQTMGVLSGIDVQPRTAPSQLPLDLISTRHRNQHQQSYSPKTAVRALKEVPRVSLRRNMAQNVSCAAPAILGLTLLVVFASLGMRAERPHAQSDINRAGDLRAIVPAGASGSRPPPLSQSSPRTDLQTKPGVQPPEHSLVNPAGITRSPQEVRSHVPLSRRQTRPGFSEVSLAKSVPNPQIYVGTLAIDSAPSGSAVFINGKRVGSTPLRVRELRAGSHAVWVEHDGYQRWTASVRVPAERQTRLTVGLRPVENR